MAEGKGRGGRKKGKRKGKGKEKGKRICPYVCSLQEQRISMPVERHIVSHGLNGVRIDIVTPVATRAIAYQHRL